MTASIGGWVSPPELVEGGGTGSSKSSSIPSSFQLDDGSICNDLGHFEEIGLSDDHEDHHTVQISSSLPMGMSMPKPPRNVGGLNGRQSILMGRNSTTTALGKLRDLTQMKRPGFSSLQSNPHQEQNHLGPPSRRSASTNGTNGNQSSKDQPPRSLSPGPPSAPPSPSMLPISNGSHGSQTSPMIKPRRLSWHQASNRKTVEELENECDSDDDVPPDTIFYNVPLSPRSARALSAAPSPERTSPREPLPVSGEATPPPTREASMVSIPGELGNEARGRTQFRSKSWSDAMLELGDEAKELSEALERHADEEIEQTAKRLQKSMEKSKSSASIASSSVPSTPMPIKKSFSTTTVIPLPPLQMTNGMIDPLPISKEKEAVLSRTRPSWLPPKSKEEEKRHLKEYKKMMRLSQEAGRGLFLAMFGMFKQEYKDRIKNDTDRAWDQHIIPNWNIATRKNETRELWWQGVAPRCRGKVWQLAFGNNLTVSPETFRLALKRARDVEDGLKKSPAMYSFKERELFNAIRRDVSKTFTELKIFQEKGPLHQSLLEVLMAYSMYRSDVGYVFGTHVVAGLLLLNLSPEQSFITLVNLLNRPLPLAFYTQDEGAMSRVYNLFLKAFRYKLPSLYQHIHVILNLPPPMYLEAMFLTLFTLHCPIDIASRIWDIYSFEGDEFLVRTAIAVMTVLESRLYGDAEEVVGLLGWNVKRGWDLGKEDEFMAIVRSAGKERPKRSSFGPEEED
ncbi:hypothetical protein L873DRAFT_1711374 [Choiromyces venosus 120613-1]|uniref:Rab-GAP TBC domain-containing protein n=1 Tax=Choiromyces venosus 120613-1 TaxID=1336337 RepID=A0A3N4JE50_9PEZI|nr:hypothetical protein L873DRAFT_1711374 [Choiromyces venosus 120613-1]